MRALYTLHLIACFLASSVLGAPSGEWIPPSTHVRPEFSEQPPSAPPEATAEQAASLGGWQGIVAEVKTLHAEAMRLTQEWLQARQAEEHQPPSKKNIYSLMKLVGYQRKTPDFLLLSRDHAEIIGLIVQARKPRDTAAARLHQAVKRGISFLCGPAFLTAAGAHPAEALDAVTTILAGAMRGGSAQTMALAERILEQLARGQAAATLTSPIPAVEWVCSGPRLLGGADAGNTCLSVLMMAASMAPLECRQGPQALIFRAIGGIIARQLPLDRDSAAAARGGGARERLIARLAKLVQGRDVLPVQMGGRDPCTDQNSYLTASGACDGAARGRGGQGGGDGGSFGLGDFVEETLKGYFEDAGEASAKEQGVIKAKDVMAGLRTSGKWAKLASAIRRFSMVAKVVARLSSGDVLGAKRTALEMLKKTRSESRIVRAILAETSRQSPADCISDGHMKNILAWLKDPEAAGKSAADFAESMQEASKASSLRLVRGVAKIGNIAARSLDGVGIAISAKAFMHDLFYFQSVGVLDTVLDGANVVLQTVAMVGAICAWTGIGAVVAGLAEAISVGITIFEAFEHKNTKGQDYLAKFGIWETATWKAENNLAYPDFDCERARKWPQVLSTSLQNSINTFSTVARYLSSAGSHKGRSNIMDCVVDHFLRILPTLPAPTSKVDGLCEAALTFLYRVGSHRTRVFGFRYDALETLLDGCSFQYKATMESPGLNNLTPGGELSWRRVRRAYLPVLATMSGDDKQAVAGAVIGTPTIKHTNLPGGDIQFSLSQRMLSGYAVFAIQGHLHDPAGWYWSVHSVHDLGQRAVDLVLVPLRTAQKQVAW